MPENEKVAASTYLVLQARRHDYGTVRADGLRPVRSLRVVRALANRPAELERDQIAVRVQLSVDPAVFSPVTAELALELDPATLIRPVLEALEPEQ